MENSQPLENVVVNPTSTPALPDAVPNLQELIKQGVSSAFAEAGISATGWEPVKEGLMTSAEAAVHPLVLLRKGQKSKKPHLSHHRRNGQIVGFMAVWPERRSKGDDRMYGQDEEKLRKAFREHMVEIIESEDGKYPVTKEDRIFLQDLKSKAVTLGLIDPDDVKTGKCDVWRQAAEVGLPILAFDAKDSLRIVQFGIERAKLEMLTLGEVIADRISKIKPAQVGRMRKDLKNNLNERSLLRRLENTLGAGRSVFNLIVEHADLRAFAVREIHESTKKPITLVKEHGFLVKFFRKLASIPGMPLLDDEVLGKAPVVRAGPVKVPKPDVIGRFLDLVRTKQPQILLYVMLQFLAGLRPEEAYRFLSRARELIKDTWIFVPKEIAKYQCKRDRKIRRRPLFDTLLAFVPGWDDPLASFIPQVDGVDLTCKELQDIIADLLREAGWPGKMPRECGRKCFLSACMAVQNPLGLVVDEAGHVTAGTIDRWYDANWDAHEGFAYFALFPSILQVPLPPNLHQCFAQELEKLAA